MHQSLARLRELGEEENTLILFLSDVEGNLTAVRQTLKRVCEAVDLPTALRLLSLVELPDPSSITARPAPIADSVSTYLKKSGLERRVAIDSGAEYLDLDAVFGTKPAAAAAASA